MAAAAILTVTLVPVLMGYLIRGRIHAEGDNPLNRLMLAAYLPTLRACPRNIPRTGGRRCAVVVSPLAGAWPALTARQRIHATARRR
ncbi:MAG: hypothetical protein U5O39_00020 [Gammaproteobacteria bacterium]|nr:hypothetical protein [Gammaproteobacteria bacterium]